MCDGWRGWKLKLKFLVHSVKPLDENTFQTINLRLFPCLDAFHFLIPISFHTMLRPLPTTWPDFRPPMWPWRAANLDLLDLLGARHKCVDGTIEHNFSILFPSHIRRQTWRSLITCFDSSVTASANILMDLVLGRHWWQEPRRQSGGASCNSEKQGGPVESTTKQS